MQYTCTLMYFNGISHGILLKIMDFIYLGKVEIESGDLDKFLQWGRNLKIDGLSSFESAEVIDGQKNEDETEQMMDQKLLECKEEISRDSTINTTIKKEEHFDFDAISCD